MAFKVGDKVRLTGAYWTGTSPFKDEVYTITGEDNSFIDPRDGFRWYVSSDKHSDFSAELVAEAPQDGAVGPSDTDYAALGMYVQSLLNATWWPPDHFNLIAQQALRLGIEIKDAD